MSESTSSQTYNRPLLIIKSAVYWVWMILITVVLGPIVLLVSLVSFHKAYWIVRLWLKGNVYGLRAICGVGWKVDGLENIPKHATLVMSKHQSSWETFYVSLQLPTPVYVAKRSLTLIPIFGWALITMKFILIDRSAGRSAINQMVEQTRERIKAGGSVVIFPEGTRMPIGAKPNYRIGGAMVAEQTGVDILPVALNSGEFWPRMSFIKWPGEVTVSFGPVIKPQGKTATQISNEVEGWIEGRMQEITVIDRFPYKG